MSGSMMRRMALAFVLVGTAAGGEPAVVLRGRLLVGGEPAPRARAAPVIEVRQADGGERISGVETAYDAKEGVFRIAGLQGRHRLRVDVWFDERYAASSEIDLTLRNGPANAPISYWEDIELWRQLRLLGPSPLASSSGSAHEAEPMLTSPIDFEWEAGPPGAGYRLVLREIRDGPTPPVVLIEKVLAGPYFHTPLTPSLTGSRYELEIAALDEKSRVVGRVARQGEGGVSPHFRFRVR